jgi:hypothetical protein
VTATALLALMTAITYQPTTTVCELGRIDRANTTSWTCLSCHDGSSAPSVAAHSAGAGGSHPVGVAYAFGRSALSLRPFGPASALVVLPAGRVECTTCHLAGGPGSSSTVTRDLCTGCHQK